MNTMGSQWRASAVERRFNDPASINLKYRILRKPKTVQLAASFAANVAFRGELTVVRPTLWWRLKRWTKKLWWLLEAGLRLWRVWDAIEQGQSYFIVERAELPQPQPPQGATSSRRGPGRDP